MTPLSRRALFGFAASLPFVGKAVAADIVSVSVKEPVTIVGPISSSMSTYTYAPVTKLPEIKWRKINAGERLPNILLDDIPMIEVDGAYEFDGLRVRSLRS